MIVDTLLPVKPEEIPDTIIPNFVIISFNNMIKREFFCDRAIIDINDLCKEFYLNAKNDGIDVKDSDDVYNFWKAYYIYLPYWHIEYNRSHLFFTKP